MSDKVTKQYDLRMLAATLGFLALMVGCFYLATGPLTPLQATTLRIAVGLSGTGITASAIVAVVGSMQTVMSKIFFLAASVLIGVAAYAAVPLQQGGDGRRSSLEPPINAQGTQQEAIAESSRNVDTSTPRTSSSITNNKTAEPATAEAMEAAVRRNVQVKRYGEEITVVLKVEGAVVADQIKLIISKRDTELYISGGEHWLANESSGIALCDIQRECSTGEAMEAAATVISDTVRAVELKFNVNGSLLPVGSYVNFRLAIYESRGEKYRGKDTWLDSRSEELNLVVQDGCAEDRLRCGGTNIRRNNTASP